MNSFQEECSNLAKLQTFDPDAFNADAIVTQDVCNFVLSLALIYNDFKDLTYAEVLLQGSKPSSNPSKSRFWGVFGGVEGHLRRLAIGLLHELFNLIQNNADVLEHEFMKTLVSNMRSNAREAWNIVVKVALGSTPKDNIGKSLLLVRNKVAFHYDPKEIWKGYRRHFCGDDRKDDRAFISRGLSMAESRFYFADAAAQEYLQTAMGTEAHSNAINVIREFMRPLNIALMELVDRFIQKRGFPYRNYEE
jgi:hypothetical protein